MKIYENKTLPEQPLTRVSDSEKEIIDRKVDKKAKALKFFILMDTIEQPKAVPPKGFYNYVQKKLFKMS